MKLRFSVLGDRILRKPLNSRGLRGNLSPLPADAAAEDRNETAGIGLFGGLEARLFSRDRPRGLCSSRQARKRPRKRYWNQWVTEGAVRIRKAKKGTETLGLAGSRKQGSPPEVFRPYYTSTSI